MVSDPIADFIIQIKNAARIGKASIVVPYSKIKNEIAEVLAREGFLTEVQKKGRKVRKHLEVGIAYTDAGVSVFKDTRRVSKPSRRIYIAAKDIKPVRRGFGHLVLSTPQGILTDKDARKAGVGGEALFEIW